MADMNTISLSGRLTRDAVTKQLPTGTQLVEFDMANNTGWGTYAKTLFVTVNLWGKSGTGIFPYLTKGKSVGVTGTLEVQEWTSKQDGSKQRKIVINSNSVTLFGSANGDTVTVPADTENDTPYQF
jgi:single-strand DNA-binding protein